MRSHSRHPSLQVLTLLLRWWYNPEEALFSMQASSLSPCKIKLVFHFPDANLHISPTPLSFLGDSLGKLGEEGATKNKVVFFFTITYSMSAE